MNIEPASGVHNVEHYLKLLLTFRALPETKRSPTFMEVSGFPHYENVCSNILRFYFDPAAEHGLKDLLLSAFLQMVGEGNVLIPEKLSLSREHPAEDQKRIDLIIDCRNFTLGIENKIYHWEANDFENYARVIERIGKGKKVVKVLLCLKKEESQDQLKGGFKRYTYNELWQQVFGMLGNYISLADPKWVTCLLDFMETTGNLAKPNMELTKTDQFFIEHNEQIEKMLSERSAFLERLHQKLLALERMMQGIDEEKFLSRRLWIWSKYCLVVDFNFQNIYPIAFDLCLIPTGWELLLYARNANSNVYLAQLMNQPALEPRVAGAPLNNDRRFIVQTWPIDADLGNIKDALRSWMRALIDANKENQVKGKR